MSRFCILMYHMIAEPQNELERRFACPPARFASHLEALRTNDYSPVSLDAVNAHLAGDLTLPDHSVAVTLDDGFSDNHSNALPILDRFGVPATVFLAVNTLGDKNRWMTPRGFPTRAMLDWGQIREMQSAGIRFGSHTLSHPCLSTLDRETARNEIRGAKKILEERLEQSADWFAYPYGDWSDETVELVREARHTLACSTRSGFNRRDVDPLLLRRIEVYGTDSPRQLLRKLRLGTNNGSIRGTAKYYLDRVTSRIMRG